jgi:hypothetical protein
VTASENVLLDLYPQFVVQMENGILLIANYTGHLASSLTYNWALTIPTLVSRLGPGMQRRGNTEKLQNRKEVLSKNSRKVKAQIVKISHKTAVIKMHPNVLFTSPIKNIPCKNHS